jgi:DNA-binding transcriptional LysR family regulator
LKKLEEEFEDKLFLRTRNGLKLTPQGRMILPEAREALRNLERIKGNKANLKFKIGCHPSVGMSVLGQFLKIVNHVNPSIDFQITNASSHDVNLLVANGEIDFGLVMNPVTLQGLIIKSIGEDHVYVWGSEECYQNKLIHNPKMLQSQSIISRWKEAPKQTIEVENLELIAQLINSGAGVGILPSQVVKSQRLSLKRVSNSPSFKDHLALVCYPENIKSKDGKLVFDALKRAYNHF